MLAKLSYRIATGIDEHTIALRVSQLEQDGYRPIGGVAYRPEGLLMQAMYREPAPGEAKPPKGNER